ncbi:MAG: LysM peptidoglycan-binding domain-containing protein [Planctomycetota bacterium]
MGKTEKIVVLSVLSLVVVLFVWSLGGGGDSSATEREASYGDASETDEAAGRGSTERLQRGGPLLVSEMPTEDPGAGSPGDGSALERGGGASGEGEAFVLPDFSPNGERGGERERESARSERRPDTVHMRPGWDLVTTVGLSATVNPDLLTYEVQPEDTWASIARDLYGQESKAALLRHNNEGMDAPAGTINVPAKDELGALGEARIVEVLRGETLWGVAERTLGSGTRWRDIYEANEDVVPNPDYVAPGTVLTIPASLDAR